MTFVITEPCMSTCDTACVSVCPVDCIPKDPLHAESTDQLMVKYEQLKKKKG